MADSAPLHWPRLYVQRYKFPRVVDRSLVPATPEPLMACQLRGSAQFRERDVGQSWIVAFRSPAGEELEVIEIHIALDRFLAALKEVRRWIVITNLDSVFR